MDDNRARYLRQQAELGGSEIYLSERNDGTTGRRDDGTMGRRDDGTTGGRDDGTTGRGDDGAMGRGDDGATGRRDGGIVVEAEASESANAVLPPSKRDDPLPAGASRWNKNPPPMPGPGLTVMPPSGSLLADAIESLGSLEAVAALISGCRKCMLCEGRTHTVPGEGNPRARLMCVGEGPGATEDETGRPFVGAAGQLLDKMLAAIECPRETVFIANIVKCRPPQNRKPLPDEAAACLPYLHRQIALVRPTVLLALGGTAAEHLLGVKSSLGGLRGKVHSYGGIPVVVTYHPAALLRNPNWKKPTWDDVRVARQLLDR